MVFIRVENVYPNLKKGKGENFNCLIETPIYQKIMLLRKGFNDSTGENSGLSKFTSCQTLISCHLGQG